MPHTRTASNNRGDLPRLPRELYTLMQLGANMYSVSTMGSYSIECSSGGGNQALFSVAL